MPLDHPFSTQFIKQMETTQQAYAQRRLEDYLAAFSDSYYSVQLDTDWGEDKAQLAKKISDDFVRFELLSMDFDVLKHWYVGETGFAHLAYITRLKYADSGRVLVDKRENLIVGNHLGEGRWELAGKIVLKAQSYFESEVSPDI